MIKTLQYFILLTRPEGPQLLGPFADAQSRNDFSCALWFGLPARLPWEPRGRRRLWFDRQICGIYYIDVCDNGYLTGPSNVTVGELAAGKGYKKVSRSQAAKAAQTLRVEGDHAEN